MLKNYQKQSVKCGLIAGIEPFCCLSLTQLTVTCVQRSRHHFWKQKYSIGVQKNKAVAKNIVSERGGQHDRLQPQANENKNTVQKNKADAKNIGSMIGFLAFNHRWQNKQKYGSKNKAVCKEQPPRPPRRNETRLGSARLYQTEN